MGRARRKIISGYVYEISFRTTCGLPFVCADYTTTILSGIVARVQRDSKVTLCHLLFMANHAHIVIVAKDAQACANFHGEIKKRISDSYKQLLGLPFLSLWADNSSSVIDLKDLPAVKERIAYLYANPARANLVDSIERYPGFNTFAAFCASLHTLDATHSSPCPWIRTPTIKKLPSRALSPAQDAAFTDYLKAKAKLSHDLVLQPNAWMKLFGITEPEEVAQVNQDIIANLRDKELQVRTLRSQNRWKVKGATRLAIEPVTLTYLPDKESRRIFIYATDPEQRKQFLAEYKTFCERCTYCYEQWKIGNYSVEWPPGSFQPPIPSRVNWLEG
jgi:hypothetical protein